MEHFLSPPLGSTMKGRPMRSWLRSLMRTTQQDHSRRRDRPYQPVLEQLEARCLLSVNTATHVAGPNIDASNLSGYQGETTIAINPINPRNMIAGSNNLGSGS